MHQQGKPELGEAGHGRVEVCCRHGWELVDPRSDQETLEARHAGLGERRKLCGVTGHDAAPERVVHGRVAGRRPNLLLQAFDRGRHRDAVQRHVHDRGDASRRGGPRRGLEALPVGAPRLVHVDVCVHGSGEHDRCSHVQLSSGVARLAIVLYGRDHPVHDHNRARPQPPPRGGDALTGDDEVSWRHAPRCARAPRPRARRCRGPSCRPAE